MSSSQGVAQPTPPSPFRKTIQQSAAASLIVGVAVAVAFIVVRSENIVMALFGAIVIAEALRPFVNRLSVRMPQGAAVGVAFVLVLAAIALIWFVPLRALAPQAIALWNGLPGYIADATARVAGFGQANPAQAKIIATLSANAGAALGPLAQALARGQAGVGSLLSALGLMFVMALFWLGASAVLAPFVLTLVPEENVANVRDLLHEISDKLSAYVTGTVVNGLMVAVECTLLLVLLRSPFPVVLGFLQGALIAVPYLGTFIGAIAVGSVVLATQGWVKALEAIFAVAIAQSIQGTFVAPLIFKRSLNIDPLLTIVAIAIGGTLFGILGIVLAVPAASVVQTLVVRVVAPAIRSSYAPR
jgi:predicted PurR-regulated permease PerM